MNQNSPLPIIPYPQEVEIISGLYEWSQEISFPAHIAENAVRLFIEALPGEIRPEVLNEGDPSKISLVLDPNFPPEAYHLNILPSGSIEIVGKDGKAIFYALQSLRQLIMAGYQKGNQQVSLPCVRIQDAPRFGWRGFMLDEARHFQGMQTVKELLDWMALLKMNVFHWHLTEDQGWRIEIKRYPRLVEVGSTRQASQVSGFSGKKLNTIL